MLIAGISSLKDMRLISSQLLHMPKNTAVMQNSTTAVIKADLKNIFMSFLFIFIILKTPVGQILPDTKPRY